MSNYIPERFEREIVLHAIKIVKLNNRHAPIMLAIDGPTGEGKTYQCKEVLERLGFRIFSLSASQFESKEAGEPAQRIRRVYDSAVNYVKESQSHMAALLIDDADVAFGNWGDLVQYTVNTQGVIGELMDLANIPQEEDTIRIPIYLTGNDLKKIYAPLRRAGRMDFFFWRPNFREKVLMIYYLYDFLDYNECEELVLYVEKLCQQKNMAPAPISFYSAISSHMYDNELWGKYLQNKQSILVGNLLSNIDPTTITQISIERIMELVSTMLNQIALSRHDYTSKERLKNINSTKKKRISVRVKR